MANQLRHSNDNHHENIEFSKDSYEEQRQLRDQIKAQERTKKQNEELKEFYGRSSVRRQVYNVPIFGKVIIGTQTFILMSLFFFLLYTFLPQGKLLIQNYSLIIY